MLAPAGALLFGAGMLWVRRRGKRGAGGAGRGGAESAAAARVVEFYGRMTASLAARGRSRGADQTPLEFAEAVGAPEVLAVTRAYNRVRYGAGTLTEAEAAEVERCLRTIEEG